MNAADRLARTRPSSEWSWSVGTLAGIDIRFHATFAVLLLWVGLSHVLAGHGLRAASAGVLLGLVFGSVVLHELGHALVARRYGIRTRDITLWPIGGMANLDRVPENPKQELAIALAGPAVNAGIAIASAVVLALLGAPWTPPSMHLLGAPWLTNLMWINTSLALFNLVPAFPMDGGRVLRSLLALRIDRLRATQVAARIGQGAALLLGLFGALFAHPMLIFVALFVWIGAQEEADHARLANALEPLYVGDAMLTTFETLPAHAPIAEGAARAARTFQEEFPVVDGNRLVGIVSAAELLEANQARAQMPIAAAATSVTYTVSPYDRLTTALDRIADDERGALAVVDGDALVGLLVSDRVYALAGDRGVAA